MFKTNVDFSCELESRRVLSNYNTHCARAWFPPLRVCRLGNHNPIKNSFFCNSFPGPCFLNLMSKFLEKHWLGHPYKLQWVPKWNTNRPSDAQNVRTNILGITRSSSWNQPATQIELLAPVDLGFILEPVWSFGCRFWLGMIRVCAGHILCMY